MFFFLWPDLKCVLKKKQMYKEKEEKQHKVAKNVANSCKEKCCEEPQTWASSVIAKSAAHLWLYIIQWKLIHNFIRWKGKS